MRRFGLLVGWAEIEGYFGAPAEVIERWLEWGFPLREINGVPILAPDLVTEWIWILDRAQRELGLPAIETAPPALHQ